RTGRPRRGALAPTRRVVADARRGRVLAHRSWRPARDRQTHHVFRVHVPPAHPDTSRGALRRAGGGHRRGRTPRRPHDRGLLPASDAPRPPLAQRGRAGAGARAPLEATAMGRVAIIGAGGFVGARFVEKATLAGRDDVLPVVRSLRSTARNAHLGRPHRLGDGTRPEALPDAIAGCDSVVNLTTGHPAQIVAGALGDHAAPKAAPATLPAPHRSKPLYAGTS